MSYILDALRKSDQLRRRSGAPTLMLGQATAATPRRPALLYYGLLALVLLGAGIAIGWLRPWQPQPTVPAPAPVASVARPPEPSPAPALQPGMASRAEPAQRAQNSVPVAPLAPAPARVPAAAPAPALAPAPAQRTASVNSGGQSAPSKALAATPKKAPPPDQGPGASSGAAAPVASVMAMSELPVAIQQELPPMSISVHAYSGKTAERLVGVNNRLLHEGDYVASGLRLEQITPDGMILSYKGYTFHRGVH